ncbi:MAG: agmatinase [Bacillota bacterium]|nr:agmatinase [Bacillota bacterium]
MSTLDRNISCFLGCEADYREAEAVLFGAPFDATTSYRPGTRIASRTMRAESYSIETYSPYQDIDLTDFSIFDGGDLDLPFGNPARALSLIEQQTTVILTEGKLPVMIGGEHLVTLGAVRAAAARNPDLHIIHFDAHADIRDTYADEKLSHATVMRRCWELVGDQRIFQFGIRSGEREEFIWGKQHLWCNRFDFSGLDDVVRTLDGKPVYLTIDLDVLDPAVFPGTGTPEAGGVSFTALLAAIRLCAGLNVVACDLTELSPPLDPSGIATATALKVLRELLIAVLARRNSP